MTRFAVDMQAFANFSQNATTAQEFSLRRCCSHSAHHDMGKVYTPYGHFPLQE
jgi:hypothetical protein